MDYSGFCFLMSFENSLGTSKEYFVLFMSDPPENAGSQGFGRLSRGLGLIHRLVCRTIGFQSVQGNIGPDLSGAYQHDTDALLPDLHPQ